jgi:hypothetical protein
MESHSQRGRTGTEHTKWSFGLIAFYLSCAGVSLGAGVGFGAYKFFDSTEGLVIGLSVSAISCVTCYLALRAARKPPAP